MKLNTIGQLKKLDDDFKLEINIMNEVSEEELINSRYPYPWLKEDGYIEYHDTGYSDRVVCFGVYKG